MLSTSPYYPTVMVRYSLFVLKVPLNPKQTNNNTVLVDVFGCIACVTVRVLGFVQSHRESSAVDRLYLIVVNPFGHCRSSFDTSTNSC